MVDTKKSSSSSLTTVPKSRRSQTERRTLRFRLRVRRVVTRYGFHGFQFVSVTWYCLSVDSYCFLKSNLKVVDLLLKRGACKEHRNVSDYTPLSLAASGGYVNIIKLLLSAGAEINSRTGSKLGISPLMLAAMNGNVAAVKLLLDMGSDINAQIETNKNTALTLACFQGRQEVVQLLLERKANLEHRAKTGLTPLMEAANGGYVEVGKVLIEKGADVNAPPVPATRDTALTIAADKGHYRFVELLLMKGANVDARNKKGCTPLWLACHGGHLDVGQILMRGGADMDAQDNRRISCLMAAFRKGHVKVIRWIVKNVTQFPSDAEMQRYIISITGEPELLKRCQQCMEYIRQAKDKQALEANKNADILLEELDLERTREESKRLAAARRREKKKKKKLEKKKLFSGITDEPEEVDKSDEDEEEDPIQEDEDQEEDENGTIFDSGIDANSQGSNSSAGNHHHHHEGTRKNRKGNKENLVESPSQHVPAEKTIEKEPEKPAGSGRNRKRNKKKPSSNNNSSNSISISLPSEPEEEPKKKEVLKEKVETTSDSKSSSNNKSSANSKESSRKHNSKEEPREVIPVHEKKNKNSQQPVSGKDNKNSSNSVLSNSNIMSSPAVSKKKLDSISNNHSSSGPSNHSGPEPLMGLSLNPPQLRKGAFDHLGDHGSHHSGSNQATHLNHSHSHYQSGSGSKHLSGGSSSVSSVSQKQLSRKDEGWKEVTRNCTNSRSKKISVPSTVISRVIGRGGCNINAIREATGAHIEVEKQVKNQVQPERIIQIKGSAECVKQAHLLITELMNEPDSDVKKLLGPGLRLTVTNSNVSSLQSNTVNSERNSNSTGNILSSVVGNANDGVIKPLVGSKVKSQQQQPQSSKIPASPPTVPPKVSAVSPSIKKPTPVMSSSSSSASTFKAVSAGKRSLIITPSPNSTLNQVSSNANTSFAAKLSHQPQQQPTPIGTFSVPTNNNNNNPPRNVTPTPANHPQSQSQIQQQTNSQPQPSQPKTTTPTTLTPTPITPPPVQIGSSHQQQQLNQPLSSSPILSTSLGGSSNPSSKNMSGRQTPSGSTLGGLITPGSLTPGSSGDLNVRNPNGAVMNSQVLNTSNFSHAAVNSQNANLAPGAGIKSVSSSSNVVGGNRPNVADSTSMRLEESSSSSMTENQPPLEYSPFNYTFSKTTGWFPGDLANPSGSGMQQPLTSHSGSNHILTGSNVARAMNFASVAASGISSSSLSTTSAQITQAGGLQNGGVGVNVVGSLVPGLLTSTGGKAVVDSMVDSDVPKVINFLKSFCHYENPVIMMF